MIDDELDASDSH